MANQRTYAVALSLLLVSAGERAAGNQPVIDRTIKMKNFRRSQVGIFVLELPLLASSDSAS